MVTASPLAGVEVREVGPDDFSAIYPLLLDFKNAKMSPEAWREMLFTYPWAIDRPRGYALFAQDNAVGFMGTIFSRRNVLGRDEVFCNASCWIVRTEYRTASVLLLKPLLGQRDCTIVNLTPTQRSYDIFAKLGSVPLETEQLLLPPPLSPVGLVRALRGSFTSDPGELRAALHGEERTIFETLSGFAHTKHALLRAGDRQCYLVATPLRRKHVPLAELQYVGDRAMFWEHRALAHAALFRTMGAAGIALDARFAEGRRPPAVRLPARRLYRPAHPGITPLLVDGLYSELMRLQI